MPKAIASLIAIVLFTSANYLVAQPKLVIQNEVDWGVVIPVGPLTETQTVKYRVPVGNGGDSTLVVSNVRVQCGCTSAPLEKDTLAPGEETAINISLNLPPGSGALTKYVTIFSNDPGGAFILRLKADVQRPIQLASSFLAFNSVTAGNESKAIINLTVRSDSTVTINAWSSTPGVRVITPMPFLLTNGQSVDIEFRAVPSKTGTFHVEAQIATSIIGYEKIELSGYGVVLPAPVK